MKKAIVVQSIEDWSGQRCVDLRRGADGVFSWAECRRDPEDRHGWRVLGHGADGFASADAARADAHGSVGWMEDEA
ncbi:hypothetical protein [Hasllibacter sp. MH4015]|uniref:hypothetical protein n=1 Tax=Hasllibacter sp. MH4015 TaxID=2854029 RepID=UPI001CD1B8BC|nr:hypothetical protein [Hasllibacter sp. MH4015]